MIARQKLGITDARQLIEREIEISSEAIRVRVW